MNTSLAQRSSSDMPYPMPMPCRRRNPEPRRTSRIEHGAGGWAPEWKIKYMAVRPDGPPHSLPDGCAVQEEGGNAVYVMCGGAAFGVTDMQDFQLLGLTDLGVVRQLPAGGLDALREWPVDGSIFRLLGSNEVTVVVGGARLPVATPTELSRINVESRRLVVLPADAADGMPSVPADGTTVRVAAPGRGWEVFRVNDGHLHAIGGATPQCHREAQAAPRSIFDVLGVAGAR